MDLSAAVELYLEDLTLGLSFLLVSVYTFFRLLTFIHLKGKGNYVIKAFHFVICITGLLRCVWFWRAPNTYIYFLNSGSAVTTGEMISQALNTGGTISLYGTFLILACYWSYMLEHVVLKTNVDTDCFVPAHLLPTHTSSSAAVATPSMSMSLALASGSYSSCASVCGSADYEDVENYDDDDDDDGGGGRFYHWWCRRSWRCPGPRLISYYCCSALRHVYSYCFCCCCYCCICCRRTTVIELYLWTMKLLLCCGLGNLAAFATTQIDYHQMVKMQAMIESVASIACMATLSVLSRRIQALLKGFGVAKC